MSDDFKTMLVVIGAFIFSVVSYLVEFWEDGLKLEKRHTLYLFRAGVFGTGLGLIAFYGSDLILSHYFDKTIQVHEMIKAGITATVAGLSPWIFATITRLIEKKGDSNAWL